MRPPVRLQERLAALELQRPTTHEGARERLAVRLGAVAARLAPMPPDEARAALVAGLATAGDSSGIAALRRAVASV